jgi:hypothetical protein
VKPENLNLERAMKHLDRQRVGSMTADSWFAFLHDEYFQWKYTAPNRYATTTATLRSMRGSPSQRSPLNEVRVQILAIDPEQICVSIKTALQIPGLGVAGASGLLALLFPESLGTVDQFVVKALSGVPDVPEHEAVSRMNPDNLTVSNGEVLVKVMRRKAHELTEMCGKVWTPRQIDKILWTYGRD